MTGLVNEFERNVKRSIHSLIFGISKQLPEELQKMVKNLELTSLQAKI
jgi:hypothetical protein